MTDVTGILEAISRGDADADDLLPLVYEELQQLARSKLRNERNGHSLQATELVHEAYLRLAKGFAVDWDSRGHFFAAAAEAMRRILIEHARQRKTQKRGGDRNQITLLDGYLAKDASPDHILAVDEALQRLEEDDEVAAKIVKLRSFAGLGMDDIASALGIGKATVYRHWNYARAWLIAESDDR